MLTINTIIRAWKDEEFRQSLQEAEQLTLPAHPAGSIELPDPSLADAAGAANTEFVSTLGCCYLLTGWLAACALIPDGSYGFFATIGCCRDDD